MYNLKEHINRKKLMFEYEIGVLTNVVDALTKNFGGIPLLDGVDPACCYKDHPGVITAVDLELFYTVEVKMLNPMLGILIIKPEDIWKLQPRQVIP